MTKQSKHRYPICFHCMSSTHGKDKCPNCNTPTKIEHRHNALKPYTVLKNRYIVGECFQKDIIGFSYLGIDYDQRNWVIIKECFPGEYDILSERNQDGSTVDGSYSGVLANEFRNSYTIDDYYSFIISFTNMCCKVPNILKERNQLFSFFLDNNTAYAIFNYIPGKTLVKYVNNIPEGIPEESLLKIVKPILKLFKVLHQKKFFGLRISPNDIFVPADKELPFLIIPWQGEFEHIGFGINDERLFEKPAKTDFRIYSYDLLISNRPIGYFSDIYSLSAIMYSSLEGSWDHPLKFYDNSSAIPITKISKQPVSKKLSNAIMKGLEIKPDKRPHSIEEFINLLPVI